MQVRAENMWVFLKNLQVGGDNLQVIVKDLQGFEENLQVFHDYSQVVSVCSEDTFQNRHKPHL